MFKSLMTKLLSEEKWDDVVRAAEDVGYRKKTLQGIWNKLIS